jgi:regulation of enolase protein 1 (concanavalin A-like superfamily)
MILQKLSGTFLWGGGHLDRRREISWHEATWLNQPPHARLEGDRLVVTTGERSDFWRTTSYGFVRDSGHALLHDFPPGGATQGTFLADFDALYDQAGLMIRVDAENWIKANVEMTDGLPHLGAVVTRGVFDWSLAPVPDWHRRPVTVRAGRRGDAVTLRARCADGPWRMLRPAPLPADAPATAGPFCCSPQRAGLRVRFTRFTQGPADVGLHDAGPHQEADGTAP